jgi:methylated-DNA-[protein]-cysteine S-methyltransferase
MDALHKNRLKTFVGMITLIFTDHGIKQVIFEKDSKDSEYSPEGLFPENVYASQLDEYFKGKRREFDFSLDISGTPFQKRVWQAVRSIPFGQTISYRDVAEKINLPNAQRAVGNALGQNPIPIVIPCHRVIRSNGELGGFTGGITIKRKLLEFEGLNR